MITLAHLKRISAFGMAIFAMLLVARTGEARTLAAPFHPMPNTVIAVSIDNTAVTLDIAVPMPDLRLAMQSEWPDAQTSLNDATRSAIASYYQRHVLVRSTNGVAQSWKLQSMTVWETNDANVGHYQELRLRLLISASDSAFDVRHFMLAYDAVIHQIPNHFALVEITQDFDKGVLSPERAVDIGVIRFDFAKNLVPVLEVNAGDGSRWRGFSNIVAIGFRHVMLGFDHILFLMTLLIVAPLRAERGRWSLFQGWRYTTKRFFAISIAFTIGHSVALMFGAYRLVHIRANVVEVLIALSIVVTAVHAIRPIFPQREWLIAILFGTVHGLAFAEGIAGLVMSPGMRALTVGGFNLGIEAAQLTAMLCAVPLLLASKWRGYRVLRVALMIGAVLLAGAWAAERAGIIESPAASVNLLTACSNC